MSVRSFRSVYMVGGVAVAALACYLVSLRVASERAALESVETQIVLAQRDIRLLQTEIGTRGRLAQLERWNARVLALSAPSADQFVPDSFQLARLVTPERKPAIDAPVVYASAPAEPRPQVLPDEQPQGTTSSLMHEAGLKTPPAPTKPSPRQPAAAATKSPRQPAPIPDKPKAAPTRLAQADPLAPLPPAKRKAPAAPTPTAPSTSRDSGKTR